MCDKSELEKPAQSAAEDTDDAMITTETETIQLGEGLLSGFECRSSNGAAEDREGPCSQRKWKQVYKKRLLVEKNWRVGQSQVRCIGGHDEGVLCLQFDDRYLVTGSYDATLRIFDSQSGDLLHTRREHGRCIRALQFDECKLLTASMDSTIKLWNPHTGECVRTLQGHTDGVLSLHFVGHLLASGSADATIRLWNFQERHCAVLRGHDDWVNKVHILGNFLFSCSDDTTARVWSIQDQQCLRVFRGHAGQVQSLALLSGDNDALHHFAQELNVPSTSACATTHCSPHQHRQLSHTLANHTLVTCSLDNSLKVWDIASGHCIRTLFGHLEGVWCVDANSLHIVSGAQDRSIKIWDISTGHCLATLQGHEGAISCLSISDTKIVSGADDGQVIIWDFLGPCG
jgi:F-box/WD-40 domain protein MET30